MNFTTPWHHSPPHLWKPGQTYAITAGTQDKAHILDSADAKDIVLASIRETCQQSGWDLHSWAVLSNHYHIVAATSTDSANVSVLVARIHNSSARALNRRAAALRRRVWFQYWDTCLTFRTSYLARLRYVNFNPEHHGVCRDATQYPWCSARLLVEHTDESFKKTVLSMPIDKINMPDDF